MARPRPPINGDVLYRTRLERGWTQVQVEQMTGEAGYRINDSNVSKLENGKLQGFRPGARKVLCQVLGLTAEQLFAPCATCGQPWSRSCMDHAAEGVAA